MILEHKVWIDTQYMFRSDQLIFFGALHNNAFQHALIKFLVALWEDDTNANIIQVFQFYITCGSQCLFLTLKVKKREKQKKLL